MDLTALASLDPAALRVVLPRYLAGRIDPPAASATNLTRMTALLDTATDDELRAMLAALAAEGEEIRVYPADPLARRISRTWTCDLLVPGTLSGIEHLQAAGERVVLVSNHLSYVDSTAADAILAWHGHEALADRVVAVAGPKVYADLFRRLAALCLCTLPTPQSASIEGAERIGPRELARRALHSLELAHGAVESGSLVLLYAEGSRSRTGRLGPFLRGVWRYFDVPGLCIVPTAIEGTDRVFPIGSEKLGPAPVSLRFGEPIRVTDPHLAAEQAHDAVRRLLSEGRAPAPGDPAVR